MIRASSPRIRCARCLRLTRRDNAVHGFGRDCAARLGLIAPVPRVRAAPQDGPDLFDAAAEAPPGPLSATEAA
ncbi:hypothetical protein Ade02nite_19480 [Paractinoplanes deccanensis]|uniref:Uncharacterized protein n=1 Tax=Paractinoplanes deccanensis TaxID=113561 RepID=A0ABQ3XZY3_9ACTN|nr:hypothetical protein [Actinoplanes deccanensis]GID73307.1 hypothetical protein Ade02nite_19480 [Actinoplanes deccanensis]